jgi:hypothetical protein
LREVPFEWLVETISSPFGPSNTKRVWNWLDDVGPVPARDRLIAAVPTGFPSRSTRVTLATNVADWRADCANVLLTVAWPKTNAPVQESERVAVIDTALTSSSGSARLPSPPMP